MTWSESSKTCFFRVDIQLIIFYRYSSSNLYHDRINSIECRRNSRVAIAIEQKTDLKDALVSFCEILSDTILTKMADYKAFVSI